MASSLSSLLNFVLCLGHGILWSMFLCICRKNKKTHLPGIYMPACWSHLRGVFSGRCWLWASPIGCWKGVLNSLIWFCLPFQFFLPHLRKIVLGEVFTTLLVVGFVCLFHKWTHYYYVFFNPWKHISLALKQNFCYRHPGFVLTIIFFSILLRGVFAKKKKRWIYLFRLSFCCYC